MPDKQTYVGEYGPVRVMHNGVQIAGAVEQTASGEGRVEWDSVYKARLPGVTVYGKGEQGSLRGVNLVDKTQSLLAGIANEEPVSAWASTAFNNTWVIKNLLPDTTYTISYEIECVEVPEYDTTFSDKYGFLLYRPGSATISLISQYLNVGDRIFTHTTFTTPSDLHDTSLNYRLLLYTNRYLKDGVGVYSTVIIRNLQIELGDTATDYEPYCGGILAPNPYYPIQPVFLTGASLTDSCSNTSTIPELYALPDGSVRDEFDPQTGVLTRRIRKLVLDGSEDWVLTSIGYNDDAKPYQGYSINNNVTGADCGAHMISCTHFPYSTNEYTGNICTQNKSNAYSLRFTVSTTIVPNKTTSEFKSWLADQYAAGTPVTVWYALDEPEIEQYDPQPLWQPHGYGQLIQTGGEVGETEIRATYWDEMDKDEEV